MALPKQNIPPIIHAALTLREAIRKKPQDPEEVQRAYDRLISLLTSHYYRRVPDKSDVSDPINSALLELWQRAWIANIRTSIPDQRAVVQVIDALKAAAVNNRNVLRDKKTEGRDKWIYKKCCKGLPYQNIVLELRKNKKGWQYITTKQGIQYAARTFAQRHNLPPPPPRQGQ
jgi:hypothetical protein